MPGRDECRGCGATLPSRAPRCLRCGRVDPTAEVELLRLDAPIPLPPTVSSQRTVVGSSDVPRGGRRAALKAAGLLAAVVLAVLVLADPGGRGRADEGRAVGDTEDGRAAEDTAAGPSTSQPPASAAPSSTRRPSTTRAPATTSTTTTLISYPAAVGPPMLGETTGGLSLYVTRGDALFRLELDNGTLTELPMPLALDNTVRRIERRGDRLLLDSGYGSLYETGVDLRGGIVVSAQQRDAGQPLHGTSLHWSAETSGAGGETVRFWDRASTPPVVVEHVLPHGAFTSGTSVGARVVVLAGGRLFTLDAQGTIRPYAQGAVIGGGGGQWLLWQSCDEQLRCRLQLGDETNPDARPVTSPEGWPGGARGYGGASIAPDGRTAVFTLANGPLLVDLASGAPLDVTFSWDPYVWSPDGGWLFRVGRGLDVEAVSTRDGRVVRLFRPPTDGQNEYTVLEIG